MHVLEQLGVALGLATLAGVNLYLTVLLTGLAVRFDLLHLAEQYQALDVLAHPAVLIVAGVLFALEFFADKIPWVDSLWDSVHTIIRPVGGVLLGLQALGEVPVYAQVVAGLVAGGAALTTHSAKAGTRLLINHSPEPVTNVAMSVTEDVAVVGGVALTLLQPLTALAVFGCVLLVLWLLFPRVWRGIKATIWLVWNKLKMPGRRQISTQKVELPCEVNEYLGDLFRTRAALAETEVRATVPCLSGKCRGVRGLSPNMNGLLVLTDRPDMLYFVGSKGLGDRVFKLSLMGADVSVQSKFLSDDVVLDAAGLRAVFRFPRSQSETSETVAMRLKELQERASAGKVVLGQEFPAGEPESANEMQLEPAISAAGASNGADADTEGARAGERASSLSTAG